MKIIAYFDMDGEIARKRLIQDDTGYQLQRSIISTDSIEWVPVKPNDHERPFVVLVHLVQATNVAARLFDERKNGSRMFTLPEIKESFPVSNKGD